ncbi:MULTISPECIES: hypothetical protein [unclassified Shinella]|uniref:hypothetical protein n=1 Tax=unclassified Shinella TaxID=2643062 RepID=UPI00234F8502|nr:MULTISPECIES: hypothetical protein [unclassified Shinella]MCO5152563.1 hypothetical protein [Shinella sp.]MDC7261857.1 hypothetical protein [Shinella sp. HY16]MDC7268752.1 hypothetical protein [Shinella sp. YZ44]
MRMIRSLIYAGLALAAMAFTISAPAVAATPTDPGIYEAVKASVEKPMIHQVDADVVCLNCIIPSVEPHSAVSRSSADLSSMTVAGTPVAVAAYMYIDPDIRC